MGTPLPADVVLEHVRGLGTKLELLVLAPTDLLGLISHQPPLTLNIAAIPKPTWLLLSQGPLPESLECQLPSC